MATIRLEINGKDIWSWKDWMAIAEASKQIKIYVTTWMLTYPKLTLPMPIMTKLINWLH
jgi:hypothetical protein